MSAAVLQWRVWSVGGVPTEVFGLDAAHGRSGLGHADVLAGVFRARVGN